MLNDDDITTARASETEGVADAGNTTPVYLYQQDGGADGSADAEGPQQLRCRRAQGTRRATDGGADGCALTCVGADEGGGASDRSPSSPTNTGASGRCCGRAPRSATSSTSPVSMSFSVILATAYALRPRGTRRSRPARVFLHGQPAGLGAEVSDQVRDGPLLEQLDSGATIVLQGLHRIWPPLRARSLRISPVGSAALCRPTRTSSAVNTNFPDALRHPRRLRPADRPAASTGASTNRRTPTRSERQAWGGLADEASAQSAGLPYLDDAHCPWGPADGTAAGCTRHRCCNGASLHITLGLRRPTRYRIVEALPGSRGRPRAAARRPASGPST